MALVGWLLSSLLGLWPLIAVLVIIGLATLLLFKNRNKNADSWAEGLPEIKPGPIWGNDEPSEKGFMSQYEDVYKQMKGLKYCLYYNGGTWARGSVKLMILDPELVAKVMITDFDHFVDNTFFSPEYMKAMGNVFGIADAQGDKWRKLRKLANGPFTLPKMKKYMSYFTRSNKEMVEFVDAESLKGEKIDVRDFIRRSVMNTLGSVGLGLEANTFKDTDSELLKHGSMLMQMWRWIVLIMLPSIATLFRVNCYNPKAEKWLTDLMRRLIKSKRAQPTKDNDVLSTLMKINEENPEDFDEVSMEKTMLQYIFDGFNTTSDGCTGIIAYIITHPNVVSKLQEEIDAVFDAKGDGDTDLTDTDINGMNYLDCIISEAMRLAAVSVTSRRVTKPWTIPGTDLTIPVGVGVFIPLSSFHNDPEYWDNPCEFDPERFSAENKNKIKTGTYAPFGLGPRSCLGTNYAKFTIKMVLVYLFRFFDLENCENLPKDFERDPSTLFTPKAGLRVKLHKREF